jgi:hypothetical protein
MSKLNNPAGRLHELLTEFKKHSGQDRQINGAWRLVLGVEEADLLPELAQVAGLLNEVRTAVDRADRRELSDLYDQFGDAWAVPIFTHGRNPSADHSQGLVDAGALVALGSLAVTFEHLAPDGHIPDEELEAVVRSNFAELLDELASDAALPVELRAAIAARVHDILWALDHVKIVGPDGVQAAVERLIGQLAIFTVDDPAARGSGIFQRTMQAASRAWTAFRAGGDVHMALEGWQKLSELLPPN